MIVQWTGRALEDVARIDRWFSDHVGSELAGDLRNRVRNRATSLQHFPRRGSPVGQEWRAISVPRTPLLLVYRCLADEVQILRVRHNREDWRDHELGGE